MDINSIGQMRGQRKTISANKYAEKLNKLRNGGIKVSSGVEAGYRDLHGAQPEQQYAPNPETKPHGEGEYALLRSSKGQPQAPQQVQAQAPQQVQASIQTPSLKFGTLFEFAENKGDIEIVRDENGFAYSYDGLALSNLSFAKGEAVPDKLKKKFKADQLYSVADVAIDLSDIADTFEKGDKVEFKIKKVKSFYQRHTTEALANTLTVEAEFTTDLGVNIPAKVTLKAHPLAQDLLNWTMQEVLAKTQVDEIIAMLED